MKKQAIIIAALFLIGIVPALAQVRPNVVVSGFLVANGSASVGKEFTLAVRLINSEPSTCAIADTATITAGFPFIMSGVSTVSAGDICNGSASVVSFPLRIDPTATGGTYQITITNNYETASLVQFSSSDTVNLFVNGTPVINANIAGSSPADVYPGDTATLTVDIGNDGAFQAQSVIANMTAAAPVEVTWSTALEMLGSLDAKQTKAADFTVEVPKDAAARDYPLSLRVEYLDENLAPQARDFGLVLHVKPKALFVTSDAGSETLYANYNSRSARLELKNTGTDTARRIKARIMPMYPFSTDGSVRYIDALAPNASAPVEFTLNIDKDAAPGTYGLDMLVDFEDAQGKSLQDTAKVSLTVQRKSFLRAVFRDYWFIWLAVAIVVALVARRRMKRKK